MSQESPFNWPFYAIFVDIISLIWFFLFGLSGQHLCCHVLSYSWDFTSQSCDTMLFTAQVPPFAWPHCKGGLAHPDDAFITTTSESYKASRVYKHSPLDNLWDILNLSRCRIATEGQRSGHITGIQNILPVCCFLQICADKPGGFTHPTHYSTWEDKTLNRFFFLNTIFVCKFDCKDEFFEDSPKYLIKDDSRGSGLNRQLRLPFLLFLHFILERALSGRDVSGFLDFSVDVVCDKQVR